MEMKISLVMIIWMLMNSLKIDKADGACTVFEFKCKIEKCIPKNWLCDKTDDCGDGSDEENCSGKVPEQPKQLKATTLNETSIHVTWMPPDTKKDAEPILHYVLTYRNISSKQERTIKIPGFKCYVTLHHLKPSSSIELSIFAVNIIGKGMTSNSIIIKLHKPIKDMVSLQAKAENSSSILVSWNVSDKTLLVGYFLEFKPVLNTKSSSSSTLQTLISIPLPKSVNLYMKNGFGPIAGPVFVKTPREIPQPPNFTVSLVNHGKEVLLRIRHSSDAKAYLGRFGESLTKSFPIKDEKIRILPGSFKGGKIPLKPFYWHYFALSKQTYDNRWSREKSVWVRGPTSGIGLGVTAVPSSHGILLMWSRIFSQYDDDNDYDDDEYVVTFKAVNTKMETRLSVKKNHKRGFTKVSIANLRPSTTYKITIGNAKASCRTSQCFTTIVKTLDKSRCSKECKHYSKCQINKNGSSSCVCDMNCPKVSSPVCASDGNSYYNLCVMKKVSCMKEEVLTLKHDGVCVSKCKNDEFKCHNNKCIPQRLTCDGIPDCTDKSDEAVDLCYEK